MVDEKAQRLSVAESVFGPEFVQRPNEEVLADTSFEAYQRRDPRVLWDTVRCSKEQNDSSFLTVQQKDAFHFPLRKRDHVAKTPHFSAERRLAARERKAEPSPLQQLDFASRS